MTLHQDYAWGPTVVLGGEGLGEHRCQLFAAHLKDRRIEKKNMRNSRTEGYVITMKNIRTER